MKNHTDVMKVLADARPARLDPPGTPPLSFALHEVTVTGGRGRRLRAAALLPAGALAAAVVAAVAVVAINPDATAPPGPGLSAEAVGTLTASQMLLAAAERSGKDTAGTGRYLFVRTESGSVLTVGSGTATYQMTARSSYETWLSRVGDEPARTISQKLGLTPLTPADETAWRAAGSPTRVMVGKPLQSGDLGPGSPVSTSAGPRETSSFDGADVYALGATNVSMGDLEKLPADPAVLRAALLEHFNGGGGDMPTDSGQGFAFTTVSAASGSIERRFVIDAATGRALGEESRVLSPAGTKARLKAGSLVGYNVVLEQSTTDKRP